MKLYHGSNVRIDEIDLTKTKPGKDFGQGFYLSEDRQQAENLARFRAEISGGTSVITEYEFDESCMANGSVKSLIFDSYTEEWAEFILKNRRNTSTKPCHDFDIVYGPIADDRVGAQIRRLENGDISLTEFMERLKYIHGITFQYYFGTETAIKLLHKL